MNEQMNEQTNKWMNEQTNERTNERTNEQTNERTNKRTNEQTYTAYTGKIGPYTGDKTYWQQMNFNQKLFHIFTTFTQKTKVPIFFKFMEYVDKNICKNDIALKNLFKDSWEILI